MNKLKFLPLINTVLIIGLILFNINNIFNKNEGIVYVNNLELFNNFDMTKEMKAQGEIRMQEKRKVLDSLMINYNTIQDKESILSKNLQNKLSILNKDLQEFQSSYFNSLNDRVSERLEGYLNEFGKAKKIKIILGSNILYAEDTIEITDEVLQYVNHRYNGFN